MRGGAWEGRSDEEGKRVRVKQESKVSGVRQVRRAGRWSGERVPLILPIKHVLLTDIDYHINIYYNTNMHYYANM